MLAAGRDLAPRGQAQTPSFHLPTMLGGGGGEKREEGIDLHAGGFRKEEEEWVYEEKERGFFLRKGLLKRHHEMVGKSIKCSIVAPAKRIDFVSFPKVLIRNLQSYNFLDIFLRNQIFTFFPRTNCVKLVRQITIPHKSMMASYSFAMLTRDWDLFPY